jgi:hypothetical protein
MRAERLERLPDIGPAKIAQHFCVGRRQKRSSSKETSPFKKKATLT